MDLLIKWRKLVSEKQVLLEEEKIENWFYRICEYYNEIHRKYHNLEHVKNLLKLCEEEKNLKKKYIVQLSIFFHEYEIGYYLFIKSVIYDPKKNDNEELSANLFLQFSNDTKMVKIIFN